MRPSITFVLLLVLFTCAMTSTVNADTNTPSILRAATGTTVSPAVFPDLATVAADEHAAADGHHGY